MGTPITTDRNYFANTKTVYWAQYVDNKKNGGNGNGVVDGREKDDFVKIIKHRYGYDYSFNKLDSKQIDQMLSNSVENVSIKKQLYTMGEREVYYNNSVGDLETGTIRENTGAKDLGQKIGKFLDNLTMPSERKEVKKILKEASSFPDIPRKREVLRDIIDGYNNMGGRNGFFEQIGTEWAKKDYFTNGEVLNFLKSIMDVIPESERINKKGNPNKHFVTIQNFYNEYSQKDPNEKFGNNEFWKRLIGCDKLDNLDEAVKKLL